MPGNTNSSLCALVFGCFLFAQCQDQVNAPKTPADQLATFELAGDLKIELVAAEPLVQEPVFMTFDEESRLWVVEMRGFMPNVDGLGEDVPVGRICTLVDRDMDGTMDSSVVFADSLVLPRSIAITTAGVLVAENIPLWLMRDVDGDGIVDEKVLLDSTYGGAGLVEHAPNGLWRGIDNWYYNAKSDVRYRFNADEVTKQRTEFRGQWGICHDDEGRLFYNYNWSQLHADLVPPNYFSENPNHLASSGIDYGVTLDRQIFPIGKNMIANRGYIPGVLDENERLQEFSAACAPWVYRGDLLPDTYRGNAFVCDPSANLIRRNVLSENELLISAENGERQKEFLASTDARFRPVHMTTGPDGAIYIADMYRGIIQHGLYMSEYLRKMVLMHNLDEPIHMGRIWRVRPRGTDPLPVQKMQSLEQAIVALKDENGMIRDQAQRMLVESRDEQVIPELIEIIKSTASPYAKIHALWTLSGLGNKYVQAYLDALNDESPIVIAHTLRIISEDPGVDLAEEVLIKHLDRFVKSKSKKVRLAAALSGRMLSSGNRMALFIRLMVQDYNDAIMRDAVLSGLEGLEFAFVRRLCNDQNWQGADLGKEILLQNLGQAIMNEGNSNNIADLLSKEFHSVFSEWHYENLICGAANYGDSSIIFLSEKPWFLSQADGLGLGLESKFISRVIHWPGREDSQENMSRQEANFDRQQVALGRKHYLTSCSSCHGMNGEGIRRFAPPLVHSEWVQGEEQILIRIMLHGMQGPVTVNKLEYSVPEIQPAMPSFAAIHNGELAAILTYIRSRWGDGATPISSSIVGQLRIQTQGRTVPWTQEELQNLDILYE